VSDVHDRVREANAAWWDRHLSLRETWGHPVDREYLAAHNATPGTAISLALSVVHWMHNAESARRHGLKDAVGGARVDSDIFFMRRYAIEATKAWLIEAQTALETHPPSDPFWRGYGHRDVEVLIRNLQVALDDFEANKP
jgi:hypothetical protein